VFTKRKGSGRLSPLTIAAQQRLSDKFGIATFTRRGTLSTIPTLRSGGFSDINVGIGRFSDISAFAEKAIQKQVAIETNIRQKEGVANTFVDGTFTRSQDVDSPIFISDPRQPSRIFNPETGGFDSGSKFSFDSIADNLPLLAAGFVGLLVIMRLVKEI